MKSFSRRHFFTVSAAFAVSPLLSLGATAASAAETPRLDPEDAQAKALAYVHQSPKPSANCANCRLYTGPASAEWGPCAIFPGKQVAGAGWCSAWVAKG